MDIRAAGCLAMSRERLDRNRGDVLLVFPPVDCRVCDKPYWEIGYVAAFLRAHGYQTTFLDHNLNFFEHLFKPDHVDAKLDVQASLINPNNLKDRTWLQSLYSARDQMQSHLDVVRGRGRIPAYDEYKKALDSLEFLLGAYYQDDFPERLNLKEYLPHPTNIMSRRQLIKGVLSDHTSTIFRYYDFFFSSHRFDSSPDLVVVWINYYYQLYPGLLFCRECRRHLSQVPIALVSNLLARNISALTEDGRFSAFFDALILSDPEVAIPELLSWTRGRLPAGRVPNSVIFSGRSFQPSNVTAHSDLDKLLTPDFPPASEKRYFFPVPLFDIIGSRGCRYSGCVFCDDIGFAGYNKAPHRTRQARRVVEDMSNLAKEHDCQVFLFWDNFLTPDFLDRLAAEIKNKPLEVIWGGHTRIETVLQEDRCQRLFESGCRFLNIGFESANPRILRLMNKGVGTEAMEKAIDNCFRKGISLHGSFIQGFPGERPEERLETARFIEKNLSTMSSFHIYDFALPKFSIMARQAHRFNIRLGERSKDSLDVDLPFRSVPSPKSRKFFDLTSLSRTYPLKRGDRIVYEIACRQRQGGSAGYE
jgi:hypothetical protein